MPEQRDNTAGLDQTDGDQASDAPAIDLTGISDLSVPNLSQYFGIWAHEPTRFLAMWQNVARMDLRQHVMTASVEAPDRSAARRGGNGTEGNAVAVVQLVGPMTKRPASLSDETSTIAARQQLRQAMRDPEVGAIALLIESGGGTVSGTADLGKDVAAAAERMPVHAYLEDLTASAAYWVASQASKIYANDRTALVGSIGTFIGLYDLSGTAGQLGMKPVLITSGGVKGMGFPGTEITEDQKAMLQRLVDGTQAEFNAAVARGRGMSAERVRELATGELHMAADALELGLIDGIQSFEQTIDGLQRAARSSSSNGRAAEAGAATDAEDNVMPHDSNQQTEQGTGQSTQQQDQGQTHATAQPATLAQLKEKFPKSTAQEREHCIEQQMTLAEAGSYMADCLSARLESREEQLEQAKAQANKPGVEPLGDGDTTESAEDAEAGDAIERWNAAVKAKTDKGVDKPEAVRRTRKEDPELYEAYLEAYNQRFESTDDAKRRLSTAR